MFRSLRLLALVALCACTRAPQPSPEYAQARELWTKLVLARGADAADDPQAEEVLNLLTRVPPASSDARDAAELLARVKGERQSAIDERTRRERLVARAGEPTVVSASPAGSSGVRGGAMASAAAKPPEAGEAAPAPPSAPSPAAQAPDGTSAATPSEKARPALDPGLKLAAFKAGYGDCFEDRGPVMVDGAQGQQARAGTMWGMKDLIVCREKLPQLAGKLALFADGLLVGLGNRDRLRSERREVELGTLPDGQAGMRVGGKVVPLPPGATFEKPPAGAGAAAPPGAASPGTAPAAEAPAGAATAAPAATAAAAAADAAPAAPSAPAAGAAR